MNPAELLDDPYVAAFPELARFWQAAARGTLLLPYCQDCGQTHWHPRAGCPWCRSDRLRWQAASGAASLHTFSVMGKPPGSTYVLAYVRLQEGPLVLTNVVRADPTQLRIDMPLKVAFRQTPQGRHAPVFEPA